MSGKSSTSSPVGSLPERLYSLPTLQVRAPEWGQWESGIGLRLMRNAKRALLPSRVEILKQPGNTGSGALVRRVTFTHNRQPLFVVVKEQFKSILYRQTQRADRLLEKLAGSRHEAAMYRITNVLVESGVCPFFIRMYELRDLNRLNASHTVIATETFAKDKLSSLHTFLRQHKLSAYDVKALLIMLLYTLETMYRIGMRHNDLHLSNVFVQRLKTPTVVDITYRTRRGSIRKFKLRVKFIPLVYDLDRAFKQTPLNTNVSMDGVKQNLSSVNNDGFRVAPTAVTNRFPWHKYIPSGEKHNLFKVMQHLRDASLKLDPLQPELKRVMTGTRVGDKWLAHDIKKLKRREQSTSDLDRYKLVLDSGTSRALSASNTSGRETVMPKKYHVGNAEMFLLHMIDHLGGIPSSSPRSRDQKLQKLKVDMRKLYTS
jgi:hypothetical protein